MWTVGYLRTKLRRPRQNRNGKTGDENQSDSDVLIADEDEQDADERTPYKDGNGGGGGENGGVSSGRGGGRRAVVQDERVDDTSDVDSLDEFVNNAIAGKLDAPNKHARSSGRERGSGRSMNSRRKRANLPHTTQDRLQQLGLLDSYVDSQDANTGEAGGSGATDAHGMVHWEDGTIRSKLWTNEELARRKFKIIFFIVYTVLTLFNLVLVYNMYTYLALIGEILNLSLTYVMLTTAL